MRTKIGRGSNSRWITDIKLAGAEVVLVVPDIGARVAQRRHDLAAEGVVLVAVADEDAQLVGRGCHETPLLATRYTLVSWSSGNAGRWFIVARASRRGPHPERLWETER